MKDVPVADAVKILRQNLGDAMPLSYWRLVRLVAISRAFGNSSDDVLDKLGKEIGKLLAVKTAEDIVVALEDAQVGIGNPLEVRTGFYAFEFKECCTCAGVDPLVGQPMCDMELAMIQGALEKIGIDVVGAKETKCIGGLGDPVCRFEFDVKE